MKCWYCVYFFVCLLLLFFVVVVVIVVFCFLFNNILSLILPWLIFKMHRKTCQLLQKKLPHKNIQKNIRVTPILYPKITKQHRTLKHQKKHKIPQQNHKIQVKIPLQRVNHLPVGRHCHGAEEQLQKFVFRQEKRGMPQCHWTLLRKWMRQQQKVLYKRVKTTSKRYRLILLFWNELLFLLPVISTL